MSESDELKRLRNRLNRLEDWKEHVLESTLDEKDQQIAELETTVAHHDQQITALETELEAILGVDDDQDSTPGGRKRDLRGAMIRSLRNSGSDRAGLTWWWKEVRDHLSTLGHDGFSKPTYYAAMDDAAASDGFDVTEKVVVENDRTKSVKAIRLCVTDLPGVLPRNQLTTQNHAPAGQTGVEPPAKTAQTND